MFYEFERLDSPDYFEIEEATDFSYPEHLHVCFEIIIILSGEMQITVDKKEFILTAGEGLLIFPHQLHSLKSTNSKHILCIFSQNLVKAYYNSLIDTLPRNNKFQPDEYLINALKKIKSNASIVEKKGILYSLCAQFDQISNSGLTSSWFFIDENIPETRALKTTFINPTIYNNDPDSFCVFGDKSVANISKYIDNANFNLWIKSSNPGHRVRIKLSNCENNQFLYTDITIQKANTWQYICTPLKDMAISNMPKDINYLIVQNLSGPNAMVKNDYISLSGIKITSKQKNKNENNIWQITSKTSEHVPNFRIQQTDSRGLLPKIFKFVEQNFTNECSLYELSNITTYDYSYLSRFFKKSTQISFNTYVNHFRLNHFAYLLINSDDSIITCALNSGFKSIRTCNRNFKELYGITPEEYRAQNKVHNNH